MIRSMIIVKELIDNLTSKGILEYFMWLPYVGNIGLNAGKLVYPAGLENVIAVGGLTEFGRPLPLNTPGQIDMYMLLEKYMLQGLPATQSIKNVMKALVQPQQLGDCGSSEANGMQEWFSN